ncbi:hypothetical protein ABT369_17755 [Dactylosporangium sp. NPDC000244]|uniref:hypothetical protein n=1 Tax=Dactylosporangium sp. NPDC000244 TaxID=3154365 RepID=UPI00331FC921
MDLESLLPAHDRSPADYARLARDPGLPAPIVRELAASEYVFVRAAVAAHPNADLPALRLVWEAGGYDDYDIHRVLRLLAQHPGADRALLLQVRQEAARRLGAAVERTHAALLALAARPELSGEEVRDLTNLPGVSRRLRRGILAVLAARTGPRDAR